MEGGELLFYIFLTSLPIGILIGILRRNVKRGSEGYTEYTSWTEQIGGWALYGIGFFFLSAIFLPVFTQDSNGTTTEHYLYLYSLKNQNDTEGDFFLGSGSIEQTEYYYYYYKGVNGYVRGKISVNSVSIQETNSRRPELVEIYATYPQDVFIRWQPHPTNQYIMYVPKNTVVKRFSVY